ncbi:MAG: 50S ribosomal protein L25/general stress protein Ctc [Actinomycetaceae bacterium]|nr:50S ribosomal protein L25/general stress protein Ctc [Actinomycetaceae bacterium]
MAQTPVLNLTPRETFGKGSSRQARRDGLIPAVIYGHGSEPVHVLAPAHDTFLIIKDSANAVVKLEGVKDGGMALVKEAQIHPVRREILHLDLLRVKADEKVEVEVPVVVIGDPVAGTLHIQELLNIMVLAPVVAIPESIEVDITGVEAGTVLRISDLELPAGVTTDMDPDTDVASVTIPVDRSQDTSEDEEAGEAAAPAETESSEE